MEQHPFNRREQQPEDEQYFQFGAWIFNVNRAEAILAERPRETRPVPVDIWAHAYGMDSTPGKGSIPLIGPGAQFDREYAMTTDITRPLLMATVRGLRGEDAVMLIDGMHRLYRAFAEDVPELTAHVLTVEESLVIREDHHLEQ